MQCDVCDHWNEGYESHCEVCDYPLDDGQDFVEWEGDEDYRYGDEEDHY